MKKEDLFDLLENVDEKYIEEALHDYDEYDSTKPVVVYQEKTRVTPLKIMAPIAACLAIVAAAGWIVANRDKLAIFASSGSNTSINETGVPTNMANSAPVVVKELGDVTFTNECKKLVISLIKEKSPSFTETSALSWDVGMLDMDFDGEDEYLVSAININSGNSPLGVYVFKKTQYGAEYIGSFGEGVRIDFDEIYRAADGGNYYYYHYLIRMNSTDGYSREGVKLIFLEPDAAENENRIKETVGVHGNVYTKYYGDKEFKDVVTFYDGNNNTISLSEFNSIWAQYPYLPKPTITSLYYSGSARMYAVEFLARKYGISDKTKLCENEKWSFLDINGDGKYEGILTFNDIPELSDIYFFGYDGFDYLGSLGIKGKPFSIYEPENYRYTGDVHFNQYKDKNEEFFYYTTTETVVVEGKEIETAWYVYKLNVNSDNSVSGELLLNYGRDRTNGNKVFMRNGDRDISAYEFTTEWYKFNNGYIFDRFAPLDREFMLDAGLNLSYFYKEIKEDDLLGGRRSVYTSEEFKAIARFVPVRQRATICFARLGDGYRVSLLGENLFNGSLNDEMYYCAEKLFITLTKNEKVIDIIEVDPKGSFFTEYFKQYTPILAEKLDEMLAVDKENMSFDLQFFTLDGAEKMSFSISDDRLVSSNR